jgi:two-component system alkaline phosphatase synthesis response regulator PhoP
MVNQKKILVVDDEPDIVKLLRVILERQGYQVITATNAEDGLVKARQEQPDLIILDVMMPSRTEGFHFAWNLRNDFSAYGQQVPILIHSAIHETTSLRFYPDKSDGTYGPGEFLPVQGFIDKPADTTELLHRIENLLNG